MKYLIALFVVYLAWQANCAAIKTEVNDKEASKIVDILKTQVDDHIIVKREEHPVHTHNDLQGCRECWRSWGTVDISC